MTGDGLEAGRWRVCGKNIENMNSLLDCIDDTAALFYLSEDTETAAEPYPKPFPLAHRNR